MDRLKRVGLAAVFASSLFVVQQPAMSAEAGAPAKVVSPDEENWLDVLDGVPNPAVLPRLVDLGLVDQSVDDLVPDVLDPWPDVQIGGCALVSGSPTSSANQLRVKASAAYGCSSSRTKISVTVCIMIRAGGQWHIIDGSCRRAVGANEASISKRTSAYCRPGTWRYRTFSIGEAIGANGSSDFAMRKSAASTIDCRTFGV